MSAFIRFSRPHTVIGTTLSLLALYLLAWAYSGSPEGQWVVFGLSLLSCLGANIYIVGLNQLTDIDIDRINKPYLPLASGEYSQRTGYLIIITAVLLSLVIAVYLGRYLLLTVILSLLLGTAYSLPPFRLKRFHFWAAFCIIAVRGLIVNLLLFLHFFSTLSEQHHIPPAIWLLTLTIFMYSVAIAWFKDIPDMEGDQRFQINTLTLRLGAQRVFNIGLGLISLTYLFVGLAPFLFSLQLSPTILLVAHGLFLGALWLASRRVQLHQPASIFQFYQFIWILFFLEYGTFTLAGWMST